MYVNPRVQENISKNRDLRAKLNHIIFLYFWCNVLDFVLCFSLIDSLCEETALKQNLSAAL